jgi:hypothetical protein
MTVEDNIPFRETFKNNLLSEFPSMEVIQAANGEEAFKGLASYPIDLVFIPSNADFNQISSVRVKCRYWQDIRASSFSRLLLSCN